MGRPFDHLGEAPLLLAQAFDQGGHGVGDARLRLVHLLSRLARTGDEQLGQLHAALGKFLVDRSRCRGDVARDLRADAFQRLADALAVIGKRLALGHELADERADAVLVLAVGPFERGYLAMHHGFELARPADGARNGVVHGGDLPPDGLAHGRDGLLGKPVGLGEAHGDFGHGRGHEAEFLGAPDEKGEEPEDDDGNDKGERGGERRGAAEQAREAARGDLV
jgi:hypothetical protein